jgi:hypothetical protein
MMSPWGTGLVQKEHLLRKTPIFFMGKSVVYVMTRPGKHTKNDGKSPPSSKKVDQLFLWDIFTSYVTNSQRVLGFNGD